MLEINPFDASILHFLNQFAQKSWLFDNSIVLIAGNALIRGGPITALFWWAWFRNRGTNAKDKEFVLSGIALSTAALFVARALAMSLPFRERPRFTPSLNFLMPYGSPSFGAAHWSSFPSDHAVLYFSLATSIFFISRKVGLLALCHTFFFVCVPRIYLGLHYPTDILAGALLGMGIACLSLNKGLRESVTRPPLHWLALSPSTFYPCLFLGTFLLATNFDPARGIVVFAWHAAAASARSLH